MYRVSYDYDRHCAVAVEDLTNPNTIDDITQLVQTGTPVILVEDLDELRQFNIDPETIVLNR